MRERYKSISCHIRAIISEELRQQHDDDHDDHEICIRGQGQWMGGR